MAYDEKLYEEGSANVFEDIGVRDPENSSLRADLVLQLSDIIRERGLNQTEIAALLDIDQPKVSKLMRGLISGFTSDRLLRFISALGGDVKIEVTKPKEKANGRRGHLQVVAV
jgi:predicted XRE-type DNA-binding protein